LPTRQKSFDLEVVARRGTKTATVQWPPNRRLPVKNVFGWTTFVSRAGELMLLFVVMFCLVSAVHKFDF